MASTIVSSRRKYHKDEVVAERAQILIVIRHAPIAAYGENAYHIDVDGRTSATYHADTNILSLEGDIFPPLQRSNVTYPPLVHRVAQLIRKHFGVSPKCITGEPYWQEL